MQSSPTVSHEGVVEQVTGGSVVVRFTAHSACSGCHAKGVCSVSGTEEKMVEIHNVTETFKIGEAVNVLLEQSQGFKALTYGYMLPLLLVLVLLFSLSAITHREGLSALIALASLGPYYLVLWLFKRKLDRAFDFKIRRIV